MQGGRCGTVWSMCLCCRLSVRWAVRGSARCRSPTAATALTRPPNGGGTGAPARRLLGAAVVYSSGDWGFRYTEYTTRARAILPDTFRRLVNGTVPYELNGPRRSRPYRVVGTPRLRTAAREDRVWCSRRMCRSLGTHLRTHGTASRSHHRSPCNHSTPSRCNRHIPTPVAHLRRRTGRTYHVTRARRGQLRVPPECACVAQGAQGAPHERAWLAHFAQSTPCVACVAQHMPGTGRAGMGGSGRSGHTTPQGPCGCTRRTGRSFAARTSTVAHRSASPFGGRGCT